LQKTQTEILSPPTFSSAIAHRGVGLAGRVATMADQKFELPFYKRFLQQKGGVANIAMAGL
jgi:hypothetical protein